ncbi:MAG: hypothetical protein AAGD00_09160 [Planctomycetota bacterium]
MTFTCPACGEDLYARPARSYAELEGLLDPPARRTVDAHTRCAIDRSPEPQPRRKPGLPIGMAVCLAAVCAAFGGLVGGAVVLATAF